MTAPHQPALHQPALDQPAGASGGQRILTVPNVISAVRLLCIPVFCWLLFDAHRVGAFVMLGALGATDWIDGWIARRFDQGSELGKILDPVADRGLLLVAVLSLMIDGVVPTWVGAAVLVREVVVSGSTLALAAAGAARIDVEWLGKAGTFGVMFALPGFLLADVAGPGFGRDITRFTTWWFVAGGLFFGYCSLLRYVPLARHALGQGRAQRSSAKELTT
jgi:cardiolipin synthase